MAVLKPEEMLSLAEDVVSSAVKKGADEAEAYTYQGLTTTVSIERGQVARSSRIIDCGLGVRAIVKKAVGFSYTNVLEDKVAVEETILRAISSARASKPDGNWLGLPPKKPLGSVEGTYDSKIVELHAEDLVKVASVMLSATEQTDKRVFPIEGGAGVSYLSNAVANSNGISVFDHGTVIECSLATVANDGKNVTPVCFEFNVERKYNIDPEWVGQEAAKLAISALKAKKVETKSSKIIFTQFALQQLLYYTFINAVKADYVQRNQSALKGKIGQRIASEAVTIYDDGLLKGGIHTGKFDAEGVPQQNTLIVEKGILRNYLYDNYTAKKERLESTGNAARAGYLSTPSVEATNFHIMPGDRSPEKLVNEAENGLIVYFVQGAHSSNPASGDFSVVAAPSWKIEKGEVTHATKGMMIAGNIFQVLANVSAVANNERKIGQLVAPWVLVENVKVIGK